MTMRTLRFSKMIIALTGFMGCGKSSVGRELSVLLGMPLVDLDKYIVGKAGKSIAEIFAESGEAGFRDIESEALAELLFGGSTLGKDFILSLGGGTIIRPQNAAMIKEKCTCFFLRATVDTLKLHLSGEQSQRPLLRGGGFEALLTERTPLYTAAADYIIDIDELSPMQTAGVIANLIS